jgi:hypothetical protein
MTDPRRPRWQAPQQPPQTVSKTLKYSEAHEPILRRLASALVLQLDELPDELQDLIIDQAALVEDRADVAHEPRDIENFIRGAKVVALTKPAPTPT